jgi:hypothetical protein
MAVGDDNRLGVGRAVDDAVGDDLDVGLVERVGGRAREKREEGGEDVRIWRQAWPGSVSERMERESSM